jgi:hypothetical protein
MTDQARKAEQFCALHVPGKPVPRQNHRRNNVTAAKLRVGRSFGARQVPISFSAHEPPGVYQNQRRILRVTLIVCVKAPDVPVIVTVAFPVAAVLLAENVTVLVIVARFGAKDAVTPLGRPDADRLTFPAKPFCRVILMELAPLAPRLIFTRVGDAARAKSPSASTVKDTVVVRVKLPEMPVTVTVTVPVAAVLLAKKVAALVDVAGLGTNDTVTPLGSPDAEKFTAPLKPFNGVIVIVLPALAP